MSDWRTLDLAPGGRSLIEASAGTGKTWTIAVLYVRLLLEQALTPAQIVVATFTDAAAQELRERIRARLLQAEALLRGGHERAPPSTDPWHAWLHRQCLDATGAFDPARARQALLRLRLALAELDIAPIGTLHALCQRILRELPFDSGHGLAMDELVSGSELQQELADDAWRRLAQVEAAPDADTQAWFVAGRGRMQAALREALKPGVLVQAPDTEALDDLLRQDMVEALRAHAGDASWFARKDSVLPRGLRALADWIEAGDLASLPGDKAIEDLTKPLEKQIHRTRLAEAREDRIFAFVQEAAERLAVEPEARRARGLAHIAGRAREERDERLRQRGQLDFDALIERVHAALQAHPALADALHARWPVALVDEFQDTDPLQYGILDRIHRSADGAPRGRLVMIGDPKQAIYRFRGGDIHTYLAAAAQVPQADRLALGVNRRSSRAYVEACNAWFDAVGEGLSSSEGHPIGYVPIEASERQDGMPYTIDGEPVTRPLVVHYLDQEDDPETMDGRKQAALQACAAQVVDVLAGGHAIGGVPLAPGDIAVLLPTNRDVASLRQLLQARGVPCVGAGRHSVFDSPWARELALHLRATAQPHDAGLVRTALATRLGGVDYRQLRAWRTDADAGWQAQLSRYERLHQAWQRGGVLAVVQALVAQAAPQLFAGRDGERALTDLRQLGELLQAREADHEGRAQLLAWLAQQAHGGADNAEDAGKERALRIESDQKRVQLMTVHAAKGLEFPLVLLPLPWAQHDDRDGAGGVVVHAAGDASRTLRFDEAAREQAQWDAQDERYRLLYVAMTRAVHACHVYAMDPERRKDGQSKNPRKDPQRAPLDAMLARADRARLLAGIDWRDGWPVHGRRHRGEEVADVVRRARMEPPAPGVHERRHSFSTLVRQERTGGLQEDKAASDETPTALELEHEDAAGQHALQALAAWKGTAFGNALHDVMERRRFEAPLPAQLPLVREALQACGMHLPVNAMEADALAAAVAERLQATLDAEIRPGLRLGQVPASHWRAEMAFDYVLDDVPVPALREACARHGAADMVQALPAHRLRGIMTGKIDLVFQHDGRFHVLDWKGNWLGGQLAAYAPAALDAAMDAHHYRLQALLYTVAVDRYLRQRMPGYMRERHLGETLYLFVRAVGLAEGAGVWVHRFDDDLLDAVDGVLAGQERAP